MVLDYYNLREQPFGVTPDSRYLYSSATHREALASLLYGIESGRGFVALIATPGMGKTSLLFHMLTLLRDQARVVFLFQTVCTPLDFLRAVLGDLGVHDTEGTLIDLQSKLNEVVTEQSRLGKPLVVIIDEAQNLDDSVLEQVRMLSNFETAREKLIQIVLCGQPQFADKLASPQLVQLRQRVSILASLKPFSAQETALYVDHRLRLAGYNVDALLFTPSALALIAECSGGTPRNINNLCFNAMSLGCALKRSTIDCDIIREVIVDLDLEPLRPRTVPSWHPVEIAEEESPMFASTGDSPSKFTGWLPKLLAACALLIAMGAALFQSHGWVRPKIAVQADSEAVPRGSAVSSSLRVQRTRQGIIPAETTRVKPGQSLYRICVQRFGNCDAKRMGEMQALNPWLNNLDHIESGQRIRLPAAEQSSLADLGMAERSDDASRAERNTR